MGAQKTSAGFASALENINPAITFVICLVLRVEKLNIRQRHGFVKVIGALLGVTGAIVMILYKGPFVTFFWTKGRENHSSRPISEANNSLRWLKGTLMVLVSCFSWSSFLILQANTLKSYPAKLSLTVMISFIGAIINAVVALVVNRGSFQAWILGWDMRIFAVVYSGVMCTGVMYYVLGMVMKEKGPVFASAFNPLTMVITTILSSIVLAERTGLGTIIGAVIVVAGLYSILWGKSKEYKIMPEKERNVEGDELPVVAPVTHSEASSTLRPQPTLPTVDIQ